MNTRQGRLINMQTILEKQNQLLEAVSQRNKTKMSKVNISPHKMYQSNAEAFEDMALLAEDMMVYSMTTSGKKTLSFVDMAILVASIFPTTIINNSRQPDKASSVAIYDFDKNTYVFESDALPRALIIALKKSTRRLISDLYETLSALSNEYTIETLEVPPYLVPVGNGMYNALSRTLEPETYLYQVTSRVATNYVENAPHPAYRDGFTFEKMIDNLTSGDPARKQLVHQMMKTIVTGHQTQDVIFNIIGDGGDGKSTFMKLLTNVIGYENFAELRYHDLGDDNKLLNCLNKRLVLGADNDEGIYVKDVNRLKSMASREVMTFNRKFLTSIIAPFSATVVQVCNGMPRYSENGFAMKRRIVNLKVEKSLVKSGVANPRVTNEYVYDKRFLEYVLCYILDETRCPYYNEYSQASSDDASESLDDDNVVRKFMMYLDNENVLNERNHCIPTHVLYRCYIDWSENTDMSEKPLSQRSFTERLKREIVNFGYKFSDELVTLKSLHVRNLIDIDSLIASTFNQADIKERLMSERYQGGVYNFNSRYFEYVGRPDNQYARQASQQPTNALDYFDVDALNSSHQFLVNDEETIDSTPDDNVEDKSVALKSLLLDENVSCQDDVTELIETFDDEELIDVVNEVKNIKRVRHIGSHSADPFLIGKIEETVSSRDDAQEFIELLLTGD